VCVCVCVTTQEREWAKSTEVRKTWLWLFPEPERRHFLFSISSFPISFLVFISFHPSCTSCIMKWWINDPLGSQTEETWVPRWLPWLPLRVTVCLPSRLHTHQECINLNPPHTLGTYLSIWYNCDITWKKDLECISIWSSPTHLPRHLTVQRGVFAFYCVYIQTYIPTLCMHVCMSDLTTLIVWPHPNSVSSYPPLLLCVTCVLALVSFLPMHVESSHNS